MAVLTAGDHVPVIAGVLVEVRGKTGAAAFWQTAGTAEKVGITGASTVIVFVAVVAHAPAFGVNVYVVVPTEETLTAGDHVPVIEGVLDDVIGNTGAGAPKHIAGTVENTGVIPGVTVIVAVTVLAH